MAKDSRRKPKCKTVMRPRVQVSSPNDRVTALLATVVNRYLKSTDFNGLPIRLLIRKRTLGKDIATLIRARGVDLVRGDGHPNPHIKALPPESPDTQLSKITANGLGVGCLYPTPETLARIVRADEYRGRPYTFEVASGACQLDFRAFDLRALEYYRNDPRFEYRVDDIHGSIVYKDEYFDKHAPALDKLIMERFGFCYSDKERRAVAVFLRDLCKLEGEQQDHWRRFDLGSGYQLHPDFYRTSIIGDFREGISIFDAFLAEKHQINIMCELIKWPPLFRSQHKSHDRPDGFGFLLRPTQKELRSFLLLLDQLMSDDLNRDFFTGIEMVERATTPSGKVISEQKGTIQALSEWINKTIPLNDPISKNEMLGEFRKIRNLRQRPAHKHEKDVFDEKIFETQRELIISAFGAVRTLRLMLAIHPRAILYRAPQWLLKAKIWTR